MAMEEKKIKSAFQGVVKTLWFKVEMHPTHILGKKLIKNKLRTAKYW